MKLFQEMQRNMDLIRKHMIDPYSECIKRPDFAMTREQIIQGATSSVNGALGLEATIRMKERDLRNRMAEKH